jgi:cytochrome c-550 PedF
MEPVMGTFRKTAVNLLLTLAPALALGHGDVAPQAVDTTGLEPLGEEWLDQNPYRENEVAEQIGASAYNQNCARCHGLGAVSGGIAPDLRYLSPDLEGDEWYVYRVREGAVRDGVTFMPKMADYLSQESLWAIRAYLETLYVEQ